MHSWLTSPSSRWGGVCATMSSCPHGNSFPKNIPFEIYKIIPVKTEVFLESFFAYTKTSLKWCSNYARPLRGPVSIHLSIHTNLSRGGSSFSRDTQTCLSTAITFSSSGWTPRRSQANRSERHKLFSVSWVLMFSHGTCLKHLPRETSLTDARSTSTGSLQRTEGVLKDVESAVFVCG